MSTRKKKSDVLIATAASPSHVMRDDLASGAEPLRGITGSGNESYGDVVTQPRAKPLRLAGLPEHERRWRRHQILQVLVNILRRELASKKRT